MNKLTTQIASVSLLDHEDAALSWLSQLLGVPKAGVFRIALVELARKHDPSLAASLVKGRMNHAVSVATKACRHAAIFFAAFTIPILSAQGFDMRRSRSMSVVRSFRRNESVKVGGAK